MSNTRGVGLCMILGPPWNPTTLRAFREIRFGYQLKRDFGTLGICDYMGITLVAVQQSTTGHIQSAQGK